MDANGDGHTTRSEARLAKKSQNKNKRSTEPAEKTPPKDSVAFSPFRALGVVSTETPAIVTRRGGRSFVTTAVGRSFHIYDCAKLRLQFVGPQFPKKVRALANTNEHTFAACGTVIYACVRGKEVGRMEGHTGKIRQILPFGGGFLLSIADDGYLKVEDHEMMTLNLTTNHH